jgi:hypothetical protein
MMDYKKLLMKYLALVIDANGDSFTYMARTEPHLKRELPVFSEKEAEELGKLEIEARETFKGI